MIASWQENYDKQRQYVKKQRYHFVNNGLCGQGYNLFSSHGRLWELHLSEGRESKNWCFGTVVLEKTLESPLHWKEIQPLHCKQNQSWIFIGMTDAEAEAPILWPPDANSWLTGKEPDAREDWQQKDKRVTEDEMVEWHHWCNERELGQTPGDGEGQEAWHARVHGVGKNWTRLSDWTIVYVNPNLLTYPFHLSSFPLVSMTFTFTFVTYGL